MVGQRRIAAAVAADMPLGCIVRAERWMAGARGPGAVCCTAAGLVLELSWPWRRGLLCLIVGAQKSMCLSEHTQYALVAGVCAVAGGASRGT